MIIELAILIVVVLFIALMFKYLKHVIFLVINSFIGFLALFGFNAIFTESIAINIWSLLIIGIGGSVGFIIVLILHFLGIAF